jgi:hypothetical protein
MRHEKFLQNFVEVPDGKFLQNFVEVPDGKRPLGRKRGRWEDNTVMDLREIGWKGVDWMHLAQDRDQWRDVVNTVMSFRAP